MTKEVEKLQDNYLVVQSWMVRELGLKGNSLIIYAIIYGFSQARNQACTCGISYFQAWTNSTKQGVMKTLNELINAGLIERLDNYLGDKRKTAYRTKLGQLSLPNLGQQSLPKSGKKVNKVYLKKGQLSLPIEGENRSTLFRATDNNINNNNFQTDKSVCQSMRACAREDETDGQTEKEFYAECIFDHWKKLKAELWGEDAVTGGCEYDKRLTDVVEQLLRLDTVLVNGINLSTTEVLKTIVGLFGDISADKLLTALVAGCAPEIKKKFNYTVTALYNAGKQF